MYYFKYDESIIPFYGLSEGINADENPRKRKSRGGVLHYCIPFALIIVLIVSSAYAIYDLNGHSLDLRDREVCIVVTGSMDGEPTEYPISTIPVDSLVMIRHIDTDSFDFKIGQVIAYDQDGKLIVHRVIDIDGGKRTLSLKGDANKTFEYVSYDDVIGEVMGVSETLGKLFTYLRSNIILTVAFVACLGMMAYCVLEIVRYYREE